HTTLFRSVRMRIDDARNDGPATSIDRMFRFDVELSDRRDAVAFDCDVGSIRRQSCAVDLYCVLNNYVAHSEPAFCIVQQMSASGAYLVAKAILMASMIPPVIVLTADELPL